MKDLKEAGKNNIRGSASLGTRYFRFDNHETSNGYTVVYLMYQEKKKLKFFFLRALL